MASQSQPTTLLLKSLHDEFNSSNNSINSESERVYFPKGFAPGNNDVIIGRGNKNLSHVGNEKLRHIVTSKLEDYVNVKAKKDKTCIISSIVMAVRTSHPKGAFVKRDANSDLWFDVGDASAREKISQMFRDAARTSNYKSSSSYKKKQRQQETTDTSSKSATTTTSSNNVTEESLPVVGGFDLAASGAPLTNSFQVDKLSLAEVSSSATQAESLLAWGGSRMPEQNDGIDFDNILSVLESHSSSRSTDPLTDDDDDIEFSLLPDPISEIDNPFEPTPIAENSTNLSKGVPFQSIQNYGSLANTLFPQKEIACNPIQIPSDVDGIDPTPLSRIVHQYESVLNSYQSALR